MRRGLILALAVLVTAGCNASDSPSPFDSAESASENAGPAPGGSPASFLAFAKGGNAPRFDHEVEVFVGGARALTLSQDEAGDPESWTTDDGSLLELAYTGQVEVPESCDAVPSPAVPLLQHEVDVRGVSVLWQRRTCGFAVLLVIDEETEIAGVSFEVP